MTVSLVGPLGFLLEEGWSGVLTRSNKPESEGESALFWERRSLMALQDDGASAGAPEPIT